MRQAFIVVSLLLGLACAQSQTEIKDYLGGWSGDYSSIDGFQFRLDLQQPTEGKLKLIITGKENSSEFFLEEYREHYFQRQLNDEVSIKVSLNAELPMAFIKTGNHLVFVDFEKKGDQQWTANWNLLLDTEFDPTLYLSLNQLDNGGFAASMFLQSPATHYMFGQNFKTEGAVFSFTDIRSGMKFTGELLPERNIAMKASYLGEKIDILLSPLDYPNWKIGQSDQGGNQQVGVAKKYNNKLDDLIPDVFSNELEGTHSIVIAQNDQLIYEQYFNDFSPEVSHDTRSVSKSIAGAITGIAIEQGYIKDEHQLIKTYLEKAYPDTDWSAGKEQISLYHLLTMSSGLDIIDFGLNRESYANEGNYRNQENWTKFILSAPMVSEPGAAANYGSGSPHLLGSILSQVLEEEIEFFAHRHLFAPLGITNYRIQYNDRDEPYFAGGWYFTSMDLLKFGMLYLNKGEWEGQQVVTKAWVEKSIQQHEVLANAIDKNGYGYLFWHKTYEVNGKKVKSVESRGTGGQYLFIVPDYNIVAVITSGNYGNNKGFQPERIMEEYILAALIDQQ